MASNEDIYTKLGAIEAALHQHIEDETPILIGAKELLEHHGDRREVQARISFINSWMKREAQRDALKAKIIESASIWAIILILGFVFYAIKDTFLDIVRAGVVKATIK